METDDISFVFFLVFSLPFFLCYFYTAPPDTSDALYQSMTLILQTRFLLPVLAHEPFIVSIPRFSEAAGSTQTRRRLDADIISQVSSEDSTCTNHLRGSPQ